MIRTKSSLSLNDTVVVYPTCGQLTPDGRHWRIDVCGTVYEAGSISRHKHLIARVIQKVSKVQPTDLQQELFDRRVRAFIAPTARGKRVEIRVGHDILPLRKGTQRNGRFRGTLRLPREVVDSLAENGRLNIEVVAPKGAEGDFQGRVHLLNPTGLSVISDIDDTIKVTDVHDRQKLIANTFLREFQPIQGMSDRYSDWMNGGAAFHYVSSSPWQLFGPLSELLAAVGFPDGTFHLRSYQLRDHMLRRLRLILRHGKVTAIRTLFRQFPDRQFVLIGDSGEKDPEIYGALARNYPDQVHSIYIRQLEHRVVDPERLGRVFHSLAEDRCHFFSSPDELPKRLPTCAR